MRITATTCAARKSIATYRSYLILGYSRSLARRLTKLLIEDARRGAYPLIAY